MKQRAFGWGLVILVTGACVSDNQAETNFNTTNEWIRDEMAYYYYWLEAVPDVPAQDVPPEFFFNNMLAFEDNYSAISNNAEGVLEAMNGLRYTAGYSATFGLLGDQGEVFILIEFVYPGTPADQVGLKRGDIIVGVNGRGINSSNYLDLYYGEGPSELTFGAYDAESNTITTLDSTVTVDKGVFELDPVVYTDIFVLDSTSQKAGYLLYAEFLEGENGEFLESVTSVFQNFKNEGITDLIVDLRYNYGGSSKAAVNMANAIAPESNVQSNDVLVHFLYNEVRESEIIEEEGEDSQNIDATLSEGPVNLGLPKVYFLTSENTASVSEQLINGLAPMMDVVIVGTQTAGEFYGLFLTTGLDADPPNNYAIAPVTVKYANSAGDTDFFTGLFADISAQENLLSPYPVGSKADPLISAALADIRNQPAPAKSQWTNPKLNLKFLPDTKRRKLGRILYHQN